MPRVTHLIALLLAVSLLAAACGGGGDGAAWCADLDEIVDEGWDEFDRYERFNDVRDMDIVDQYHDYISGSELDEADLEGFAEALDEAIEAGRRHDGRAAVRAWEESLRDAC